MLQYSPKITTDGLVMCLDASQNKSYPTTDLPVKGGLGLWLDASDDSTFSYSSGTSVSQWRDKSGNNFHATQALSANQPSRSTTQNSRKTVNFDGTNDTVTIPNFICNSEMSIFVVSNCGTTLLIEHSTDTNSNQGFYFYGGGTGMIYITRATGSIISNSNWLSGGYSIASAVNSTGLDLLTYKNGSQQTIITDGRSSLTNTYITNTLYIGSRGANSLWSSGPIAEIIIYNRKVSNAERNLIHTYLGQKWGILNTDRSIIDLSGFNDNGLLGNGTTTAMPAFDFYNKGALRFDGADDYLVASIPSIAASSTVAIWIKSSNYDVKIPISINGDSYGSGPNIFFFSGLINWNTGDSADNPFSGSSYPDGNWHYIVVTNDAATNAKLYIDGVLIGTAAYRSTLSTVSDNFWVGRFHGDNNYTINANIAAAQLYNKVLSAAEVLQNYEAQKSKFANTIVQNGLVLNLDAGNPYSYAGSGTTWYDVSGGGYNATIVNAPTFVSDSIKYFTCSSTQNFTISNPISSQPNLSQIWTVSAWVNIDTITGAAARYLISGLNNGVAVEWFDSGTLLYLNGGANDYYTYGSSIEGSGWVYLTFLFRNSDGYRKIYNNLIDITTSGPNNTSTPAGNLATFTIANNMRGKIAQIIMYNRLLTVAEIAQNYNTTKGRFGL
jgi:hypothetical protein